MQSLVGLAQLFERSREELLVLKSLTSAQRCQAVQAHIDANCSFPILCEFIWNFNCETHKPPVSRFRDPCACHLPFEAKILRQIDPSELGNPDAMIAQLELIVGEIEAGFASLLPLEARTASLAFKERRKCLAQVEKWLIRGVFGDFPRPGELLPSDLIKLLFELERRGLFACFILAIPLRKCPVPYKTARSCGTGKVIGLLRRGMEPDLVCFDHW